MPALFQTARTKVTDITELANQPNHPRLTALLEQVPSIFTQPVVEHLPPYFHNVQTTADAQAWFERLLSVAQLYVVEDINNDEIIGLVFTSITETDTAQLGYLIAEPFWRQGFASEILQGFLTYARGTDRWQTFISGVERNNQPSIQLMQKLGFCELESSDALVAFYQYNLH